MRESSIRHTTDRVMYLKIHSIYKIILGPMSALSLLSCLIIIHGQIYFENAMHISVSLFRPALLLLIDRVCRQLNKIDRYANTDMMLGDHCMAHLTDNRAMNIRLSASEIFNVLVSKDNILNLLILNILSQFHLY